MFRKKIFCTTILVLLFPAVCLAGQPCRCTQQNVVGTYVLAYEGTLLTTLEDSTQVPVPTAGLSIVMIDWPGTVSAHGYMAVGDNITQFGIEPNDPEMSGEIIVNSDCTGIVDWGDDMVGELIIQNGGSEISSIMISGGPLGSPIVTGRWKRISRIPDIKHPLVRRWSFVGIGGTYVLHQSGVNIIPGIGPAPGALLGLTSINDNGTLGFRGTAMVAGTYMPFTLVDGMWEEGELACTVRATGGIMAGGVQYFGEVEDWIVVLDGGNELWGIALSEPSGSPVTLLTAKRVSLRSEELE